MSRYEQFEKKEVHSSLISTMYKSHNETAIVAGCEYSVGITMVLKSDTTREVCCLNKRGYEGKEQLYRKVFTAILGRLSQGYIDHREVIEIRDSHDQRRYDTCGMANCAFK